MNVDLIISNNNLKKERIDWIDVAKGIVIMLMVVGHSSLPKIISDWIYSFHMPFFFIISGVTTRWDVSIFKFLKNKVIKLMLPFFIYSILNILLFPFYGQISLWEYFESIMINGWGGIALWFVPILFLALAIVRTIKGRYELISIIIILIVGFVLSKYNVSLPWTLATVPIATFWVYIGKLFHKVILNINKIGTLISIFLFIICLSAGGFLSTLARTDLAANAILPLYITIPSAILGFIVVCICSIYIVKCQKLEFIQNIISKVGYHTFEILAFSQVVIMIVNVQISDCPIVLKYGILVLALYIIIHIIQNVKKLYHNIVR